MGLSSIQSPYLTCNADAVHGAHIQQADKTGTRLVGKTYIVPLCAKHNNPSRKKPFYIDKNCEWIQETKKEKCKTVGLDVQMNNYFFLKVGEQKTKPRCGCADHSQHYYLVSRSKRVRCAAMPCRNKATQVAPMKSLDKRTDRDRWLAPLCKKHGKKGTEIYVERSTIMVSPRKHTKCP